MSVSNVPRDMGNLRSLGDEIRQGQGLCARLRQSITYALRTRVATDLHGNHMPAGLERAFTGQTQKTHLWYFRF